MRRYIFVLVLSLLTMAATAQNRVVRGVVYDTSRRPLKGAVVSAIGYDMKAESNEDGTFAITVPISAKGLKATKEGYSSHALEIDGSYLMFTLKAISSKGTQAAATPSAAEQSRVVRGVVFSASNMPIKGATLLADRKTVVAESRNDGTFEVSVSTFARSITARKEGCLDQTLEIDGSYLMFSLKPDKTWEREQAEKAAAREKFVVDSLVAIQVALVAAREKYVADSLAAVKRAEREEAAKEKADKKAAQKAAVEKYDSQFKNHGFICGLDFAYGYQVAKGDVVFKDRGWREYGDQIPLQLCFSVGYRVNYLFAISAGAGVLYDVKNISIKNDSFAPGYYPDFRLKQIDVPIFLKADLYMSKGKVQPLLSVSGGLYALSVSTLVDAGIGCSVRISKSSALNILASFRTTPWPYFDEEAKASGYKMAPTPGFKVGFSF